MPSQEEYLDNLLKGIENEETTESVEEKKKAGTGRAGRTADRYE